MSRASCIYRGVVHHHRFTPVKHSFRYGLFMLYLDLAELPDLFAKRWLWSSRGPALAEFRRSDYPGDPGEALEESIRALVGRQTGSSPRGPIRLLTHLRYFGYGFNPVSFFYCFDPEGRDLVAVVADVANTPWGERHPYVIDVKGGESGDVCLPKQFHVSPFMPMDLEHRFRLRRPGERLFVGIDDWRGDEQVFSARLALRRTEISGLSLARVLLRYPFMTGQVVAGIYVQALKLYLKGVPYFEHPGGAAAREAEAREVTGRGSPWRSISLEEEGKE